MNKTPENSQHYKGILIEWYDRLLLEEKEDIKLYSELICKSDQPVLELACGTGRLMLEFLKSGIDIDGVDCSNEMLNKCKEKGKEFGLKPNIYLQKMEELSLKRKYKTIFISGGSFQLIDSSEKAIKTLQKIYKHLENNGKFVLDINIPWDEIKANKEGLWEETRSSENKEENTRFVVLQTSIFDFKNQLKIITYKYELYKDNKIVSSELDTINLKWYSVNEFILMLEKAGFKNIKTYDKKIFSAHTHTTVFEAYKL
ncbi:MAG: class I SAM-dependent methyltransferase [Bacteroidales bacterium]|nr:class I SAM-dependent methyltransferase [Bacteroidales bacterium]